MYFNQECLLKVVWKDKRYKWFRVGAFKRVSTCMRYFRSLPDFYYAKCYQYQRGKPVGAEIGNFGYSYQNGVFAEAYRH